MQLSVQILETFFRLSRFNIRLSKVTAIKKKKKKKKKVKRLFASKFWLALNLIEGMEEVNSFQQSKCYEIRINSHLNVDK